MSSYAVVARDASFQRVGKLDRLTRLAVIARFNDAGAWSLSLALGSGQSDLISQLAGVIIHYGDETGPVLMSGPVTHLSEAWDESNAGRGTLTVSGVSDDVVIGDRLAWPNPGSTISNQSTNGYDRRSGVGETVIKAYVDANAGPEALTARQTPGLTIETDGIRGNTVEASARMKPLDELITELCVTAELGWRVVQVGGGREFQVFEPQDRTLTARFGAELGNMLSYRHERQSPSVTRAIVGGGGEDTARKFRQVIDSDSETAWGRKIERFRDARQTEENVELDQAGAEMVVEGGPQTSVTIQTIDTPQLRFGEHYALGDRVTVEPHGSVIRDVLREVEITWDASDGATLHSAVGTHATSSTPRMHRRLADLQRRVAELEAKK